MSDHKGITNNCFSVAELLINLFTNDSGFLYQDIFGGHSYFVYTISFYK